MVTVGTVVIPVAGKYQGRPFAVVGLQGTKAYIANGRQRKLSRPKCKSLKHLQVTCHQVALPPTLTDKQLKKALTMLDK